jgi:V/A-type H+/Na+-transporting ATPase subunit E
MGLEVVLNEILAEGQKEQSQILADAKAQAAKIAGEAETEAAGIKARIAKETSARIEALRNEILGASEFEARRNFLSTKRELLSDLRARVLEALSKLPAERNKAILTKLATAARKELPKGTVHARQADLEILAKDGYTKGKATTGAGGFVIESADGQILLDLRFETLLDDVWKQILIDSASLFEVS